jgi:hypothetical protein
MQTQKLLKKIENSYFDFLEEYVSWNKMSLVFFVPKIPIKWNENIINDFQFELKKLTQKNNWLKLNTTGTIKWTIIDSIEFENNFSYLKFIWKFDDFKIFCDNVEIIKNFKFLHNWILLNYKCINNYTWKWQNILKVVKYFLTNPKKHLFARELEIDVDTKFVERNKVIIEELLVFIDKEQENAFSFVWNSFEDKFWLKTKSIFIRFRFLDYDIKQDFFWVKLDDLYLSLQDFTNLKTTFKKVFIVENEINYLTFPFVKDAILIWWKWFNISNLKHISWMKEKEIYYFWDLDSHWFKILAQCRKYFRQTKSIFMNREVFDLYNIFIWEWKRLWDEEINNLEKYLEKEEFELLKYINKNNLRLEQENIRQEYIEESLKSNLF